MDVLIAIPCLLRGGTEMQTLYLARALVRASYHVNVVCYFQYDNDIVREFEAAGCKVEMLYLKRELGAIRITRRLRKYFATSRPDVVHVQYMAPGALPVLAARLAGIKKVIATVHQPYTAGHGIKAKILLRSAARLCDYFLAVSEVAERSWFGSSSLIGERMKKRSSRHCTLHNTVDVAKVAELSLPLSEKKLPAANALTQGFVFGYVGRVRYEKGVDILFKAFAHIALMYDNVQLLVVGDGPDLQALKEEYSDEPWWQRVVLAGQQTWENAMKHFSLMNVVVVPSRFEGFGLTVIEAMASSLPVIASNTGGLSELIKDNYSGLHFENENSKSLYRAMKRLFEEPELCFRLSANANKIVKQFDVSKYDENIMIIYQNMCD